jgi:membrane protein implicated in regulation of membrane protease activity
MTWSEFYLLCFIVGFTLSVLSFLAGAVHIHLPFKMHLPFHAAHHGVGAGGHQGGHGAHGSHGISWFNAMTIMTFLAWFGGIGYILTKHSHLLAYTALSIAAISGLFASALVFKFMARIVKVTEAQMLDWDYRIEGVLGTLSSPIRANGIGEILFEQNGARKSAAARSEDGTPLPKGAEVVITKQENGMVYVRKWEEFAK